MPVIKSNTVNAQRQQPASETDLNEATRPLSQKPQRYSAHEDAARMALSSRASSAQIDPATAVATALARIEDADVAQLTAELTSAQIVQQPAAAMLAQANALPDQVLALLRD